MDTDLSTVAMRLFEVIWVLAGGFFFVFFKYIVVMNINFDVCKKKKN